MPHIITYKQKLIIMIVGLLMVIAFFIGASGPALGNGDSTKVDSQVKPMIHTSRGTIRIKDVVNFQGVRDNQLVGYGLVVGLNGTGDTLASSPFTRETIVSMLERLNVNTRDQLKNIKTKNIAAVMVSADLPPFARKGSRIDVGVSALGDSKSLRGGTLLVTPLVGADGEVYAVGQGSVATGGFTAGGTGTGGSGSSITQGVPTNGRISNGGIIEREVGFELNQQNSMMLALKNPDFTTAQRISEAINSAYKGPIAQPLDPSTVQIAVPADNRSNVVGFMTAVEQLTIKPDQVARVVIDAQNGVIVMGEHVRISKVAISHGNLTIKITEAPQVSQPSPFARVGATRVVPRTDIDVDGQDDRKMIVLQEGTSLDELVRGLNALGVSPRDMIVILQTIKAAGALQSEIEVM